jgi:hypothetical protein
MVTNRTPINRPPQRRLTAEAIQIFKEMIAIDCTCGGEACPACQKHLELDAALGTELGLKPWQFPALVYPGTEPGGSPTTAGPTWENGGGKRLYAELAQAAGL